MKKPLPQWAVGIRSRDLKHWIGLVRRFCADCGLDEDRVGEILFGIVCAMNSEELAAQRAGLLKAVEKTCGLSLLLLSKACVDGDDLKKRA